MDQLKERFELINKEADKIPYLNAFARKAKVPSAAIMLAVLLVLVFIVVIGVGSSFVSRLIGVGYPTLRSILALESKGTDDDK